MSPLSAFASQSSGRRDVGTVCDVNEDAYLDQPDLGLWLVADGMGGHSAGELAGGGVVSALETVADSQSLSLLINDIDRRLMDVNTRLRDLAEREDVHISGSTAVALAAAGEHCVCLRAGDSRIYRIRDGAIDQLTQDHALVEELVEKGVLRPEKAVGHPQSNLVTRAVGAREELFLDTEIFELEDVDCFGLCSDGLDKEVSTEDIAHLAGTQSIDRLSDALVDLAVEPGA